MTLYVKQLIVLTALTALTSPIWAKPPGSDALFDEYAGREGYTLVDVGPNLFRFASLFGDEMEAFEAVDGVKILRSKNSEAGKQLSEKMTRFLSENRYTDMVDIIEAGKETTVYGSKSGETIDEILVIENSDHTMVISVRGALNRDIVNKIRHAFHSAHCTHSTKQHGA